MPEGITVRGIPEVMRNLKSFPGFLAKRALAKALNRALDVFEKELMARTPVGDLAKLNTSTKKYGHLLQNIEREVTIDSSGNGGRAAIGFGKKGFVALFVEYGHANVRHISGVGKKASSKGDVEPHPFMRPTFEAAADAAFEAFIEEIETFMAEGSIAA